MGVKSEQKNRTFSDFEKSSTDKKNRSKETLINMEKAIAGDKSESILLRDYPVGDKKEGNKAYPPLVYSFTGSLNGYKRLKLQPQLDVL